MRRLPLRYIADVERLRGFDDRGHVYTDGVHVYRHVPRDFADTAAEVLEVCVEFGLFNSGVVQTTVHHESDEFLVLRHPLYTITYPNEWTAGMLLDACVLTLDLAELLDGHGLALKDALPSNVVFDRGRPVFIDFSSIIPKEELGSEQWLVGDSPGSDPREVVLKKMFLPFMVVPYLVGAGGAYNGMESLLRNRWCNSGERAPGPLDVLRLLPKRNALRGYVQYRQLVRAAATGRFPDRYESLRMRCRSFNVSEVSSDYSSYYEAKDENQSLADVDSWTMKQRSVDAALDRLVPGTVLDLGCNTGWFSVLAAGKGARVVSIDSDSASVETLHRRAKREDLSIVSACLPFEGLLPGGKKAPRHEETEATGSLQPARVRFRSSMVLCLGLIHHLVLGSGHTVETVMGTLADLSSDSLVLEYVSLEDDRIVEEPGFFPNIEKMRGSYTLAAILDAGGKFFRNFELLPSNPATRTIIVFTHRSVPNGHGALSMTQVGP